MGLLLGAICYFLWGILPLFWHALGDLSSDFVLLCRVISTVGTMLLYMLVFRKSRDFLDQGRALLAQPRIFAKLALASFMIALNWLTYIWAVQNGQATESSLGYYLMPLFSLFFARVFLGEKLSGYMKLSLILALIGVGTLFVREGRIPLVSLVLATSFSLYGLLKKGLDVSSEFSMLMEAALVSPFLLLGYLIWGSPVPLAISQAESIMLVLSGVVTILPLLLFSQALKRAPLSLVGFIQYLNPSMQLLMAIFVFKEAVNPAQIWSFVGILLAILVFVWGQISAFKKDQS